MRVVVVGVGVIGATYGWLLGEAGHDVDFLVRPHRAAQLRERGLDLRATDLRGRRPTSREVHLEPTVVAAVPTGPHAPDLVIVPVLEQHLDAALAAIAGTGYRGDVLVFGNVWDPVGVAGRHLPAGQALFGFPHMVGGGRQANRIETIVFDEETQLGEADGRPSQRLERTADAFRDAGLNPETNPAIIEWLHTHYIQQASSIGPMLEAGSGSGMLDDRALARRALQGYREGMEVCRALGIDPARSVPMPWLLLRAPLGLLVPLFRRMLGNEHDRAMLDGHFAHGAAEMVRGFDTIMEAAEHLGVDLPTWRSFSPVVERWREQQVPDLKAT